MGNDISKLQKVGRIGLAVKQKPFEFCELEKVVNVIKPVVGVEIGVLRGGVLSEMQMEVKIGIDVKPQTKDRENVIIGDSHKEETLEELKRRLQGREIDFLFIDGDHSYMGAKKDFEMYYPLVRKGGVIALHDILDTDYHRATGCFVGKFWEEIRGKYHSEEIIDKNDPDWGGIGVIWK